MNHKQLTLSRAQMVKFGHTAGELLAEQRPEHPFPFRTRRRYHSQNLVNWRQGDTLAELVAGFYSEDPVILRISGNCQFFRPSYNLLRQLGFFPRCPVCYWRCRKVWNGSDLVCSRSGHLARCRDWRPDQAPTRFELSCLPTEIVSLAPLAIAIASGVPMEELVRSPCARLLKPCYLAGPHMGYTWTAAADALSEEHRLRRAEHRARREALNKRKEQAS